MLTVSALIGSRIGHFSIPNGVAGGVINGRPISVAVSPCMLDGGDFPVRGSETLSMLREKIKGRGNRTGQVLAACICSGTDILVCLVFLMTVVRHAVWWALLLTGPYCPRAYLASTSPIRCMAYILCEGGTVYEVVVTVSHRAFGDGTAAVGRSITRRTGAQAIA